MKVYCEVTEVELDGDYGAIPGVCARCTRCSHEVESYGTSPASVRRSLAVLREECPKKEDNFYIGDDGGSGPHAPTGRHSVDLEKLVAKERVKDEATILQSEGWDDKAIEAERTKQIDVYRVLYPRRAIPKQILVWKPTLSRKKED